MITLKEALDWELIRPIELRYLVPAEQDVIIEMRDKIKQGYKHGKET